MSPSKPRPGPVTLIALFQFCGAGFILMVALLSYLNPDGHWASRRDIQTFVYIATRHNIAPEALMPVIMPLVAAYLAVTGWGLWYLHKWARHLLIATSGMTVILWLRAFLVRDWALGENILKDQWARQTVYAVITLNALILACLTLFPDVARAFNEDD